MLPYIFHLQLKILNIKNGKEECKSTLTHLKQGIVLICQEFPNIGYKLSECRGIMFLFVICQSWMKCHNCLTTNHNMFRCFLFSLLFAVNELQPQVTLYLTRAELNWFLGGDADDNYFTFSIRQTITSTGSPAFP